MKYAKWIIPTIALFIIGCAGQGDLKPAKISKEAVSKWLDAAVEGDEEALLFYTVDEAEEDLLEVAGHIGDRISELKGLRWNNTNPKRGGDKAWHVMVKGMVITFEVLERGDEHWEVLHVMTSE